jgi:hypothetical protein
MALMRLEGLYQLKKKNFVFIRNGTRDLFRCSTKASTDYAITFLIIIIIIIIITIIIRMMRRRIVMKGERYKTRSLEMQNPMILYTVKVA